MVKCLIWPVFRLLSPLPLCSLPLFINYRAHSKINLLCHAVAEAGKLNSDFFIYFFFSFGFLAAFFRFTFTCFCFWLLFYWSSTLVFWSCLIARAARGVCVIYAMHYTYAQLCQSAGSKINKQIFCQPRHCTHFVFVSNVGIFFYIYMYIYFFHHFLRARQKCWLFFLLLLAACVSCKCCCSSTENLCHLSVGLRELFFMRTNKLSCITASYPRHRCVSSCRLTYKEKSRRSEWDILNWLDQLFSYIMKRPVICC